MSDIKNIFVSHYHTDAERIEDLKSLLGTHGMTMKDSSIYENKNPNNAHIRLVTMIAVPSGQRSLLQGR